MSRPSDPVTVVMVTTLCLMFLGCLYLVALSIQRDQACIEAGGTIVNERNAKGRVNCRLPEVRSDGS